MLTRKNFFREFLEWYAKVPPLIEVIAVVGLILLQTWIIPMRPPILGIAASGMIFLSWVAKGNTFETLGFKKPWVILPFLVAMFAVFLVLKSVPSVGGHFKDLHGAPKFLGDFVVYLPWGILQKAIENGFIFQRLLDEECSRGTGDRRSCEIVAMALCAWIVVLLHLPNTILSMVVFPGTILGNWAFLKWRNVYIIGVAHALAGTILLHTIPVSTIRHLMVGKSFWLYHP